MTVEETLCKQYYCLKVLGSGPRQESLNKQLTTEQCCEHLPPTALLLHSTIAY